MTNKETWAWLGIGAATVGVLYYMNSQGLVLYYMNSQGLISLGASTSTSGATPLSVYPQYAYTAQPTTTTSMAATARQQASTAVIPPTPLYASVQQQNQTAIYEQCVGATVCSPLTGDTQLGF